MYFMSYVVTMVITAAIMALFSAFLAHYFYKKGKINGINKMCASVGWERRDVSDLSFEAYLDLMDVRIMGIIPLGEALDMDLPTDKKTCKRVTTSTKVSGLIPTFHKHMILLNKKDPERFVQAFASVAPILISIKEGANKLTPANLPNIISGVGKLIKDVGSLLKLVPELQKAVAPLQDKLKDVKPHESSGSNK